VEVVTEAWLFVRGEESVRMTRLPLGATLLVCGPGHAEHSHHFDSEASLEEFRRWYEQRLFSEGWAVQGTVERRSRDARPPELERRRGPRR
jgi:hypothetical protein